jgi:hypothetical protein
VRRIQKDDDNKTRGRGQVKKIHVAPSITIVVHVIKWFEEKSCK